jgi:hypothetical protein
MKNSTWSDYWITLSVIMLSFSVIERSVITWSLYCHFCFVLEDTLKLAILSHIKLLYYLQIYFNNWLFYRAVVPEWSRALNSSKHLDSPGAVRGSNPGASWSLQLLFELKTRMMLHWEGASARTAISRL